MLAADRLQGLLRQAESCLQVLVFVSRVGFFLSLNTVYLPFVKKKSTCGGRKVR